MFKLIFLIFGLGVGFGGGVYWAHHNPDAAATLSAEEEKRFLEAQLAVSEKIQSKLEQLSGKSSSKTPGSGFVSSQSSGVSASDVNDLKNATEKQQADLRARIEKLR